MKKFFAGLIRFLALVSEILFILTAVPALLMFGAGRKLLASSFYKSILEEARVYEKVPSLTGDLLVASSNNPCAQNPIRCQEISLELRTCFTDTLGFERYLALNSGQELTSLEEEQKIQACIEQYGNPAGEGGMPAYLKTLSPEQWALLIQTILPPDEIKNLLGALFDDLFAYLNGDISQVSISIVSIKSRLAGPAGAEALTLLLSSQPPCTADQLLILTGISYSEETILCSPPPETLPVMVAVLHETLRAALAELPDEFVLLEPYVPVPSASGPFGGDPISTYRALKLTFGLSPLLPLFFLACITLLRVRTLQDWLRWWGTPLLVTGGVGMLIALLSTPFALILLKGMLTPRLPSSLPLSLSNLLTDILTSAVHKTSETIALQAGLLLLLAIAALVGALFVNRHRTAPA